MGGGVSSEFDGGSQLVDDDDDSDTNACRTNVPARATTTPRSYGQQLRDFLASECPKPTVTVADVVSYIVADFERLSGADLMERIKAATKTRLEEIATERIVVRGTNVTLNLVDYTTDHVPDDRRGLRQVVLYRVIGRLRSLGFMLEEPEPFRVYEYKLSDNAIGIRLSWYVQ
jgi:hypothetical protein